MMDIVLYGYLKKISSTKRLKKVVLSTSFVCVVLYLSSFCYSESTSFRRISARLESTLWYRPSYKILLSEVVIPNGGGQYGVVLQKFDTSSAQILGWFVNSQNVSQIKYFNLHDEKTHLYADQNSNLKENRRTPRGINGIGDYFNLLKTSTGSCRKLSRFGGDMTCTKDNGTENFFDGYKYICMSEELQIENSFNSSNKCLVLSFGINVDTSFDESIEDLGCEVFMFDMFNYEKPFLKTEKFMHFYQMALGTQRLRLLLPLYNLTLEFNSLNNIIIDHGLQNRLINVLKIDIEGWEWKVLDDLCSQNYLQLIGQIAVEVHSSALLNKTSSDKTIWARNKTDILGCFEGKGFRRVSYFDTPNHKVKISDPTSSTKYEFAGELLMVNTKWFDKDFRKYFYKKGYNFKFINY